MNKIYICEDRECPFIRECAQHSSAGDFREEGGFSPELILNHNGVVICKTKEQPVVYEGGYYGYAVPKNIEKLGQGMVENKGIKPEFDYEI